MKQEDLKQKSKGELIEMLLNFYESPYISIYFSIKSQLDKLSTQIEKAEINFSEGDKAFEHFVKWGEKSLPIAENLQTIISKIDAEELARAKAERASAASDSVENFRRR